MFSRCARSSHSPAPRRRRFAQAPSLPQPDSVFLEELTWMEVRDAIAGGKTTVIIPDGRHRAERAAPRARETQFSGQVQSRRDRDAPRERARRACHGVRARRGRQSADRPHALRRHHHDTAGRVRQSARVCGAQLQAARVPRCRPHRRQRRQSGRAAARRRGAEQGMGGDAGARASHHGVLPGTRRRLGRQPGRERRRCRLARRHARHVEPDVHQPVDAAIRQVGGRKVG